MKVMPGLIGIGVGPGDVELLTVKAVKAIQNADIIKRDEHKQLVTTINQLREKLEKSSGNKKP